MVSSHMDSAEDRVRWRNMHIFPHLAVNSRFKLAALSLIDGENDRARIPISVYDFSITQESVLFFCILIQFQCNSIDVSIYD